MAEKIKLYKTKLKHGGLFNFKEAYRVAFEWLKGEGYDISEKDYKEVVGTGGAKEIVVNWEATDDLSDYFQALIKIRFHLLGITKGEMELEGIKYKMDSGMFEFHVEGVLIKDPEGDWDKNPFSKFLRKIYDKHVIPERIEQYQKSLMGDVDDLVAYMKSFLRLQGG